MHQLNTAYLNRCTYLCKEKHTTFIKSIKKKTEVVWKTILFSSSSASSFSNDGMFYLETSKRNSKLLYTSIDFFFSFSKKCNSVLLFYQLFNCMYYSKYIIIFFFFQHSNKSGLLKCIIEMQFHVRKSTPINPKTGKV